MIDLTTLRNNPEPFKNAVRSKHSKIDIDSFLKVDEEYRSAKVKIETLRAEQNAVSKELPKLKGVERDTRLAAMKGVSNELKGLETGFRELEARWNHDQLLIPNPPLERVPLGKDSTENVEIRRWGEAPKFEFTSLDHVEIGKRLDLLDIERGVKIAGARNYFLKGDGALLQHAVLNLAIDHLTSKGFRLFDCPHIVKYEAMMGTGYFPGGEDQAYHLDERDPDLHLIGTAEVSVASYHQDEILDAGELPKRYAGFSPCYRREAGTYGKDTQGIYRIHQFYKVEQVVISKNDPVESARLHAELLANAEAVMQLLELPYRVVDVCTGDMGQGQVYKNDIEAWMPSRNDWGETHSCSTFYDFQARRLQIRYKDADGKKHFCHTLNNTCIASPRILIPLLEVHQNEDGTVAIPKALRKYMGDREQIG